jgi:two-component system, probable response regulator PhcQ
MHDAILIVDDESHVIAALKRSLMDDCYQITGATSGEEALQHMGQQRFKVVISDERMPGMGGAEFLSIVCGRYPETIRIILTGHASIEATMKAVNSGEIYRFFTKPWDDIELRLALRTAIEKYDLEEENRRLLRTVKHQSQELRYLENHFPGISQVRKDSRGAILIDLSDDELAAIVTECNRSPDRADFP